MIMKWPDPVPESCLPLVFSSDPRSLTHRRRPKSKPQSWPNGGEPENGVPVRIESRSTPALYASAVQPYVHYRRYFFSHHSCAFFLTS